ncbi:MAG TPA: guanylate kinase [Ignavibacteriales bacterium]|nr:guanylate kinase [Ignavibacteriales bacterium]HEX3073499.1 guanylate kinase [Ignavibacteriales bacterium]
MSGKNGNVFVFAAPSGSGKTTIIKNILNSFPDIVFSISATTRKKRENEVHGKDYFFLTEEEFKSKIERNEFIEWERFYDYYYGTLKSFVDETLGCCKSVLLDLDVKGAVSIKKLYPEAALIFIAPPSMEILETRLRSRGTDSPEDLAKRIERAKFEMTFKDKFDYIIVNDDLQKAVKQAETIIKEIKTGVK